MGFWEHLEELRWTIIKSAIVFAIFAILIAYFLKEFNHLILYPLQKVQKEYPNVDLTLRNISVVESFNIIIQICVFGGLVAAAPFILFFVGQFVSPALTQKELSAVLPMCLAAVGLFVFGAVFSYFLLVTSTLRMSVEASLLLGFQPGWTGGSYYSTLMWLVLGVGASFEFPLLIILLVWLGIMSVGFLRKYRRHAIVVIFVIAALITPTADPLTQTIFAAPLYILYEGAIIVSSRVEKRRDARLRFDA
jgi:sec-independent protein translocase protein TatC